MPVVEREVERLRFEFVLKTGEELWLEIDPDQGEVCCEAIRNTGLVAHPSSGLKHWQFVKPGEIASITTSTVTRRLGGG